MPGQLPRFFFLLLSLSSITILYGSQPQSIPDGKNVFILAGQSNMAGRGGVVNEHWDGVVPRESRPNPLIFRLNARLQWEQAREPLHADIDHCKTNGIGPGMAFANQMISDDKWMGVVGLVPCAIGGTNISRWRRGGDLYRDLVLRAQESTRGGGGIRGLVWYQGESDTRVEVDADSYGWKMEKLIRNLRFDLNFPTLPVIQVALASGEGLYIEKVREAQLGVDLPGVITIDAKGLPLEEDKLHLTTESQVKLGKMLADAYLKHFTIFLPILSSPDALNVDKSSASQLIWTPSLAILSLGWNYSALF
ncbi:probable carbohydrate esterase At4g34215 [Aristolochia californica]|uniref:probable carbohydrate esterase At4g34215 n=1 Tax=Aristolochia californica TaxID=171875 RepID=UPI0035E118EA